LSLSLIPLRGLSQVRSIAYALLLSLIPLRGHSQGVRFTVPLRAFLLLVFGDIPAVLMAMKMKGHNGVCPCCFCEIRGVRAPGGVPNSPLYVPLNRAHHPVAASGDSVPIYNPRDLPKRTHNTFLAQAHKVAFTNGVGDPERRAKHYGIKGVSVLSDLSTIRFPDSFPYNFMHLIWENVIKLLFLMWFDNFKDLGTGTGNYKLSKDNIKIIGAESAASRSSIPYAFGPAPPNIANKVTWTADTRCFWTLHVGPTLLQNRLPDVYYIHYLELVKLLNICLEWDIDQLKIPVLRKGFAAWVERYEQYILTFPRCICD
jgi:hypothetical protein